MARPRSFPDGIAVEKHKFTVRGHSHFVELPQRYYDSSFMMAHFPAPVRHLRKLLPDDRLVPVEIVPQVAVLTLAAFEYRHVATLKPYNEVAVMVPVRYEPAWNVPFLPLLWPDEYKVGFWIHHLPVTSREARDVGIGVWGFPKIVADISFRDVGWMHQCKLREGDEDVLTFSVATGETRLEARQFHALSVKDGELIRTLIDTRGQYYAWYGLGRASFELGSHEISDELGDLEVQKNAIAGLFAFSAKSRLHPGTRVAAVHSNHVSIGGRNA